MLRLSFEELYGSNNDEQWSPGQFRALQTVLQQRVNLFLTGPGGTGKSAVLREIVQVVEQHSDQTLYCTATTGIAASNLDADKATTVHRWAGLRIVEFPDRATRDAQTWYEFLQSQLRIVRSNRGAMSRWRTTDLLIIDEVSMLSSDMLELLDDLGRTLRRRPKQPMGGIQLVFSGDFLQLAPVKAEYCFLSPRWNLFFPGPENVVELSCVFRQRGDASYVELLNHLRLGMLSPEEKQRIADRAIAVPPECEDTIPYLYPTNDSVLSRNMAKLQKLSPPSRVFTASLHDEFSTLPPKLKEIRLSLPPQMVQREKENLMTQFGGDGELELRVGARVMSLVNEAPEGVGHTLTLEIYNGLLGTVEQLVSEHMVQVRFDNGVVKIVGNKQWHSNKVPGLYVSQLPLTLAWAISIHKSQGMTLDRAALDLGHRIFAPGQMYVALSRVKQLDGVYLQNLSLSRIKVDAQAAQFYLDGCRPPEAFTPALPSSPALVSLSSPPEPMQSKEVDADALNSHDSKKTPPPLTTAAAAATKRCKITDFMAQTSTAKNNAPVLPSPSPPASLALNQPQKLAATLTAIPTATTTTTPAKNPFEQFSYVPPTPTP